MGFFDFLKSGSDKKPSIDLSDFKFVSDDHVRTQNGQTSTANNKGAWRGIRVQSPNNEIFTVTMYNLTGNHPVWGDNIQMAPKQMKMIEENADKIVLKGFGNDAMGSSFSDYGLTLHKSQNTITNVTLHMFDRNTEIKYSKGNPEEMKKEAEFITQSYANDPLSELKNFKQKWENEVPMQQKMMIALQSDSLNNMGCDNYDKGNIDVAINYFNQALQIMPINDDALKNLKLCYHKLGNASKVREIEQKLNFVNS